MVLEYVNYAVLCFLFILSVFGIIFGISAKQQPDVCDFNNYFNMHNYEWLSMTCGLEIIFCIYSLIIILTPYQNIFQYRHRYTVINIFLTFANLFWSIIGIFVIYLANISCVINYTPHVVYSVFIHMVIMLTILAQIKLTHYLLTSVY
jgi:hypothetical protein